MGELAWHIGKVLENWGIQLQAWGYDKRAQRADDITIMNIALRNVDIVKQQVKLGYISEARGEELIAGFLSSYNNIRARTDPP